MTFKIGKNLALPESAVTMKIAIVGRTGSGKTNTAVTLAEQMIDAGIPIAILDPQGDWWGLRSKYPIAILGGEHGDVPLEPTGGAIAADFVVNERIPVLLDLFTMGEAEMVRFATAFADRLWQTNRQALHVFLDEADLFAPQSNTKGEKSKCLGKWQNVCRRGRSRGIGLTMITQRTAVINKDLLTQADPLIIHRLTAPQDLKAIDDYLSFHGEAKSMRQTLLKSVAGFRPGEAAILSPGELEIEPTRISVPLRKSFDSGATPTAGQKVTEPRSVADVDLGALTKAMADTIERAKLTDPKELQKRIRELETELHKRPVEADQEELKRVTDERDALFAVIRDLFDSYDPVRTALVNLNESYNAFDRSMIKLKNLKPRQVAPSSRARARSATRSTPPTRPTSPAAGTTQFDELGKAERQVLRAMFWLQDEDASKSKVAFYADYSVKSSGFEKALSNLRTKGLITGWKITDDGKLMIPANVEPKPRGPELREWLRHKLGKAENTVLDVLIESNGQRIDKVTLAERANYSDRSSGFEKALSRLRSLEAAEGFETDGGTKAADVFFE